MLCLSGFELYSRWVPLIAIGQQCFNSCRVTTKGQGKRKQEQNGGVNSPFRKNRSRKIEKKAENFLVFLPLADKVLMSMHGHAGYHDMHIAILRANQKYNLKKLLSGVF